MESSKFFTRADELRFRRITWLLGVLETKDESNAAPGNSAQEIGPVLGELTWLANLLVRNHEVVAVMPRWDRQEVYVVEPQFSRGIEGTCYIARNTRRDIDTVKAKPVYKKKRHLNRRSDSDSSSGNEALPDLSKQPEETSLQITLCDIEKKKFDPFGTLPGEDRFKDHVEITINCLKEIEERNRALSQGQSETSEKDIERLQREERVLIMELHVFIFRSCFRKMSVRAGYHCQVFRERKGVSSKVDYSALFRPLPGWEKAHLRVSEVFSDRIKGIYRYNMEQLLLFHSRGPQLNPAQWEDSDWLSLNDVYSEFTDQLMEYAPNVYEHSISQYCSQEWDIQPLPAEKGFYLTAAGRKAYHELLTTCVDNTLLGLKIMPYLQNDVSRSFGEDSEIHNILLFAAKSLRILFYIAYHSPLLGIHLKWLFMMSSPTVSQQHTPDPDPGLIHDSYHGTEPDMLNYKFESSVQSNSVDSSDILPKGKRRSGYADQMYTHQENQLEALQESSCQSEERRARESEAMDEIADIIPDFRFLKLGTDRMFPVQEGPATAILRWLRLITLHTCSIESLVLTKTCSKLKELDVKILQTSLPRVDMDMEPLDIYLKRLIPAPEDRNSLSEEVGRLSQNRTAEFGGTWHCEAVLLSLYLQSHEDAENTGSGISDELRMAARNLFPHIVAVSKQCCPVCTTLFRVVSQELKWRPIAVIGNHETYSACSLPPWLPKRFGDRVTEILEQQLQVVVDEKLEELRRNRKFSRGSVSPIFHGTFNESKAIGCLSNLSEIGHVSSSKKQKHY